MKYYFFVSIFVFSLARADESANTRIRNFYQSTRALGMGNAFSAVADDYAQMFYNPASLSYRNDGEIQFNLLTAGLATRTLGLAQDIEDATKVQGTNNEEALAISQVLEKYYGKAIGARLNPFEYTWVRPNWGISLLIADVSVDGIIQRQLGPVLDLNVVKDTSLAYAYSTFLSPDISIGALAKFTHRSQMAGVYSALDLATDSNVVDLKKAREGIRFDLDIGMIWTFGNEQLVAEPQASFRASRPSAKLAPSKAKKLRAPAQASPASGPENTSGEPVRTETKAETTEAGPTAKSAEPNVTPTAIALDGAPVAVPAELSTSAPPPGLVPGDAPMATEETVSDGASPNATVTSPPPVTNSTDVIPVVTDVKMRKISPLTLSFVVRNILGLDYSKSTLVNKEATDVPKTDDRVFDVGGAYLLYRGSYTHLLASLELKNMMHREASLAKCGHAGIEFSMYPWGWLKSQLRAGMNQTYFTAGAGVDIGVLNIDVVTYGEEVGTSNTRIENRVNAFTLGMKF